MQTPAVGNTVRFEVEGVVTRVLSDGKLHVGFGQGNGTVVAPEGLEIVEDLQPGDVVIDSDGFVYQRFSDGMWCEPGNGDVLPDSEAVRPLTLLLRDGKKV